jgi:hypothetical protein
LEPFLKNIECTNCGAPLAIDRNDFDRGLATCDYCGATLQVGDKDGVSDADLERGLKMIGAAQQLFGIDLVDSNEPADRPHDTRIELLNYPGVELDARIPPGGTSLPAVFLTLFTVAWCGFMIVWNAIGIATSAWPMVAFGIVHDAVAVFLASLVLWKFFGREHWHARSGRFVRVKKLFCLKREKVIDWAHIEDIVLQNTRRSRNESGPALFILSGTKKIRLATNCSARERRWLHAELRKFFEAILT